MRIINHYNHRNEIPIDQLQTSNQRKWYSWNRIYIVESEGRFAAVSLNFFERLAHVLFRVDYFKEIFAEKSVTTISPSSIPSSTIPSLKKTSFIVDVYVTQSAGDYKKEVVEIVSRIAGKNFGQNFDSEEHLLSTYLKNNKNSNRMIVIFICTSRRPNIGMWNNLLSSVAEAVGHQGRVIFKLLSHTASLTRKTIKEDLFNKSVKNPITEEQQKLIEINTYQRDDGKLAEGEGERMSNDLKELIDQMSNKFGVLSEI